MPLEALVFTQLHRQCMVRGPERRVLAAPGPSAVSRGRKGRERGFCFHDCSEQSLRPKIVCAWELGSQHIPPRAGAGDERPASSGCLVAGGGDLRQ